MQLNHPFYYLICTEVTDVVPTGHCTKGNDKDPVGTVADFLTLVAKDGRIFLDSTISALLKERQFEPEVTLLAVRSYLCFSLSDRELEDRGVKGPLVPKGDGKPGCDDALPALSICLAAKTEAMCSFVSSDAPCSVSRYASRVCQMPRKKLCQIFEEIFCMFVARRPV
jgi:hypothetical protein